MAIAAGLVTAAAGCCFADAPGILSFSQTAQLPVAAAAAAAAADGHSWTSHQQIYAMPAALRASMAPC